VAGVGSSPVESVAGYRDGGRPTRGQRSFTVCTEGGVSREREEAQRKGLEVVLGAGVFVV
jgi:hypothetical protein